jgi:hypothetical protein
MGSRVDTLASLPGVEYVMSEQALYVDIDQFSADYKGEKTDFHRESWLIKIVRQWRRLMPNHPVRVYHVRGM